MFGAPSARRACGGAETSFTPKVLRNEKWRRRRETGSVFAVDRTGGAGVGGLPRWGVRAPAPDGRGRTFVASYPCGADRGGWRALELAEVYFSEALGLPGEEHRRRRVDCYRAAEMLLLHAAARGSIGAHCRLGVIYEGDLCEGAYWDGLADRQALHKADTPCDERAYLHFSFGAYHGHGECCWRLGDLAAAGRGCASSAARAFSLYRRAFDLGSGRIDEDRASTGNAALRLARAFELGRGCEQDFRRARTWYRLAAIGLGAAFDAGQWHFKRERIEARRGVARMAQEHAGTSSGQRGRRRREPPVKAALEDNGWIGSTGWHPTLVF